MDEVTRGPDPLREALCADARESAECESEVPDIAIRASETDFVYCLLPTAYCLFSTPHCREAAPRPRTKNDPERGRSDLVNSTR